MFFGTWAALGRLLVIGPLAYAALVLRLRISGKRTLTKLWRWRKPRRADRCTR